MDTREFPVLTDAEAEVVHDLSVGLGDTAARVLAYLVARTASEAVSDGPATLTAIRIGTDLNRNAVKEALDTLESEGFIESTTVEQDSPGRPPKAWMTDRTPERARNDVFARQAERLIDQGLAVVGENALDVKTRESASDAAEVTIGLNWDPNGLHLPFFAAAGEGEYERRSVDVEWASYRGSRAAVDAIEDGTASIGIAGAATVISSRHRGDEIIPIAAVYQRPLVVLYTTRNRFGGPLERADQLVGHTVGMPVDSEAGMLAKLFLSQAGVLDAVDIVDMAGEEQNALASGTVDVVTGVFTDPLRLETEANRVESIHVAGQYPIFGPMLIASRHELETRPSAVQGFLAGSAAGWAHATRDPTAMTKHLREHTDEDEIWLEQVFSRAGEEFASTDAVVEHGWGWQSETTWNRLGDALSQLNLLTSQ